MPYLTHHKEIIMNSQQAKGFKMSNQERITDRYKRNAEDFDQIVIDTFKIIEEKDGLLTKAQEEIEGLRETLTLIGSQPTIEYGSHAALKICVIKARKALDKLKEHNK